MRSGSAIAIGGGIIAALGVLFVAVYLLLDTGESAGREERVTLNEIVENPARYEGEQVTVSGEWAESEHFAPEDADQVIVLGDDAGKTLVVVPQLGVNVPEVDEDSVLRVTGVVRLPERGDAGFVERAALLDTGDGLAPVISAESVALAATQDPIAREAVTSTVDQLLSDPRNFDDAPVVVRGSVSEVGGRGLVLTQDGESIFVSAPASELDRLSDGERVRVRADVALLSSYGEDALEKAIRSDPPQDQPRSELNLDEIPIERGEPYLLLRTIEGAG